MRVAAGARSPLRLRGRRPLLPSLKAVPAELVSGADLVGKAKRVEPALLLRSPAAVPGKLEQSRITSALDHNGADEIGAPGPSINVQPVDRELGVSVEQVIDEPDYLDARNGSREGNRGHVGARCERDDLGLEALRRAGARKQFGIDRHGRNIQMCTPSAGSGDRI
jgi:hypothetical protein